MLLITTSVIKEFNGKQCRDRGCWTQHFTKHLCRAVQADLLPRIWYDNIVTTFFTTSYERIYIPIQDCFSSNITCTCIYGTHLHEIQHTLLFNEKVFSHTNVLIHQVQCMLKGECFIDARFSFTFTVLQRIDNLSASTMYN